MYYNIRTCTIHKGWRGGGGGGFCIRIRPWFSLSLSRKCTLETIFNLQLQQKQGAKYQWYIHTQVCMYVCTTTSTYIHKWLLSNPQSSLPTGYRGLRQGLEKARHHTPSAHLRARPSHKFPQTQTALSALKAGTCSKV